MKPSGGGDGVLEFVGPIIQRDLGRQRVQPPAEAMKTPTRQRHAISDEKLNLVRETKKAFHAEFQLFPGFVVFIDGCC